MKGRGAKEDVIIRVLMSHSNEQRQAIKLKYKQDTGKDLEKDLRADLKTNIEEVVLGLLQTPAMYDAALLRKAIEGKVDKEDILIEVLFTRTHKELETAKQAYQLVNGSKLEDDVVKVADGQFRKMLLNAAELVRDDKHDVDGSKAKQDAEKLSDAAQKAGGCDETVFTSIFSTRNYQQLVATFDAYKAVADREIESTIIRETSGPLQQVYSEVVKIARSKPAYFAEKLHKATKDTKINEAEITRILVSRAEIDLKLIKAKYQEAHGKNVTEVIMAKTKGDFETVLKGVLGEF